MKDKYTTILRNLHNILAAIVVSGLSALSFPAQAQKNSASLKLSTVVIDPGHGGKDAGCVSQDRMTMEKTIVLDISKRLANKMREGYPDMKVIMTRKNDTFVELQGRADIANRNKANLFISIHVNSVPAKRTGPNGYSIHILGQYTSKNKDLYAGNMDVVQRENSVIKLEDNYTAKYEGFDPSDQESYIFMNLMQNAFLEQSLEFAQILDSSLKGGAIKSSRGISQDPFWVLWRTAMPSVLIECGFMSNPDDRAALKTEEGRERIASDIYNAFKKYKKAYDGSVALERESAAKPDSDACTKVAESSTNTLPDTDKAVDSKQIATSNNVIVYGTQVLVTSKDMKAKDPCFKGYEAKKVHAGKYFKYIIGISENLDDARRSMKKIKELFPDSFLVKIDVNEVSPVR
jgi:N-acetylmuramoyl-L-alanine amidase